MTKHNLLLLTAARRMARDGSGLTARTNSGLSLREVADAIGVAHNTLWKWERGERAPRGPGAVAWAEFVDSLLEQSRASG